MSIEDSRNLNSAYYTPETECLRLLWAIEQVWGSLNDKRLLEPSVGSGAFIRATQARKLEVEWVTNEMVPDANAFVADFNRDFLTLTPEEVGPIDIVCGNPPFSGMVSYDGRRVTLGQAFILHSLKFADRVAMVLPPESLRAIKLHSLPDDVAVVAHTAPKFATYNLGGSGAGEDKDVNTTIVLFERLSSFQNEYTLLTGDIDGFDWVKNIDDATHAIGTWGTTSARCLDGSWGRRFPYAKESYAKVTNSAVEALLAEGSFSRTIADFTSAAPSTTEPELSHLLIYAQRHKTLL